MATWAKERLRGSCPDSNFWPRQRAKRAVAGMSATKRDLPESNGLPEICGGSPMYADKFSVLEVAELRSELLQSGLDARDAAELMQSISGGAGLRGLSGGGAGGGVYGGRLGLLAGGDAAGVEPDRHGAITICDNEAQSSGNGLTFRLQSCAKGRRGAVPFARYCLTFLPKVVWTGAPMEASRSLADCAFFPSGASSRYLLRASAVPGAGTILPSLPRVALPRRLTPFW